MAKWLLLMDLDGTAWDNMDVSRCRIPFKKIDSDTIQDSNGTIIRLKDGLKEFLQWSRDNSAIVSTLTWNDRQHVIDALDAFSIRKYFDYLEISPDARKDIKLRELMETLKKEKIHIPHSRMYYLDDRDIHIDEIRLIAPEINFLHMGLKVHNLKEARKIISARLSI